MDLPGMFNLFFVTMCHKGFRNVQQKYSFYNNVSYRKKNNFHM